MQKPPPYTLTNESIVLLWEGKPHTFQKTSPNYLELRRAILEENWDVIEKHLTPADSITTWAEGKFLVKGEQIFPLGEEEALPRELGQRMVAMATKGEDPTPVFNFWQRLKKNPSYRSVHQLWGFLQHKGHPLTKDGCFLAYKGVRNDYKDQHSGTFDNAPGEILEMPRNKISDDPAVACHEGFHVGALAYAQSFASRVVVCKVDPEHVVCVPNDHSQQKMRVCKYVVLGNHGSILPDTSFTEEKVEEPTKPEYEEPEDEHESEGVGEVDDPDPDTDAPELPDDPDGPDEDEEDEEDEKEERPAVFLPKGYSKLNKMGQTELMAVHLDELRQYATKGMLIIGASKIPGGKLALVQRILKVRGVADE